MKVLEKILLSVENLLPRFTLAYLYCGVFIILSGPIALIEKKIVVTVSVNHTELCNRPLDLSLRMSENKVSELTS